VLRYVLRDVKGSIASREASAQHARIYRLLHVYVIGSLPAMTLSGKKRDGARVRKQNDTPRTPYRRASEAGVLDAEASAPVAAPRVTSD